LILLGKIVDFVVAKVSRRDQASNQPAKVVLRAALLETNAGLPMVPRLRCRLLSLKVFLPMKEDRFTLRSRTEDIEADVRPAKNSRTIVCRSGNVPFVPVSGLVHPPLIRRENLPEPFHAPAAHDLYRQVPIRLAASHDGLVLRIIQPHRASAQNERRRSF